MGYASGEHRAALFATGVVLFAVIMILNSVALAVSSKRARKAGSR
jgi:ABC-type phosphate transport system permease subunit